MIVLLTIYSLEINGDIIHVNSALPKADMNTIKSAIDVRKRLNPSLSSVADAQCYRQQWLKWLNNVPNFFKVLQLAITLPVLAKDCCPP